MTKNEVIERLKKFHPETIPPCGIYAELLFEAKWKLGISIEEVRKKYGLYTNEQWLQLLNQPKDERRI